MRLDHDRIPRSETGEDPRVPVPRREGRDANRHSHTSWNNNPLLVDHDRITRSLRLLPPKRSGKSVLLSIRVGHCLYGTIQRMRATCLERHEEALSRGMHDGVGHLEADG
jgi:hypothetical protein